MARKIYSPEEIEWTNPTNSVSPKPYLSDEIWPDDPRDPKFTETVQRMKMFYCDKRDRKQEDLDALKRYLLDPQQYMIVWGEVGIGKSWFLRYELLAGEASISSTDSYHAGVIDMLGIEDTVYRVLMQLRPIIEMYFDRFCGGTREALLRYLNYDLAKLDHKKLEELTEGGKKDAEIALSKWVELRNSPSTKDTIQYVRKLLSVLQHLNRNELLILLIDNIDKTSDVEQEKLVKLAVRLLRNPQIRLIIPLRKSSRLLLDRFSVLKEFTYNEMELHPLNLREMLYIRFQYAKDGTSLSGNPKIYDSKIDKYLTFPQLFTLLFGQDEKSISEGGDFLLTWAASNAREALSLTEKLLYSSQLKGLSHIGVPDYTIAALMLNDSSLPKPTPSGVLNLFNNEEPELIGNSLIRFRVLEYFWETKNVTSSDVRFQKYFQRLGYDLERIQRVIELFVMTQLLISLRGLSPDDIRKLRFDDIGPLEITRSGLEFKRLLNRMWYFVSVKRDVFLPDALIRNEDGREYITHGDFIEWLRSQEENEKISIRSYTNTHGEIVLDWGLRRPHRLAAQALRLSDYQQEEE